MSRIRRGIFQSIVDLQAADHNAKPEPSVWTASVASILAKLDTA
jgi:hypothetical protein